MNKIYHTYCVLVSQEQIRVILWWQQGSRKKIQTSLSSARSHVQLYKIGSCQINDDKVSIVHFHVLMSFYSIYAILSQIRFCRDLRFFCVNFWGQKLRLRNFFDKYDVCLWPWLLMEWGGSGFLTKTTISTMIVTTTSPILRPIIFWKVLGDSFKREQTTSEQVGTCG